MAALDEVMVTLTLTFPDDETADNWIGWYLDGGGDYQWSSHREEDRDLPALQHVFKAHTKRRPIRAIEFKPYEDE